MRMEDVRIHEDKGDHFVVSHKGGAPFKVAKAGMAKATLEKVQAHYAHGGIVRGYDEGGEIKHDDSPAVDPATGRAITPEDSEFSVMGGLEALGKGLGGALGLGRPSPDDERMARQREYLAKLDNTPPPAVDPAARLLGAASSAPGLPMVAQPDAQSAAGPVAMGGAGGGGTPEVSPRAPAQPVVPAKPAPSTGAGLEAELIRAGRAKQQGEDEAAKVAGQVGQERYAQQMAQAQQLKAMADARNQQFAEYQKRADAVAAEIAASKIDPNRYLSNRTTGQVFRGSIAMILGGIGGAMTGQGNPVLQMMEKAAERDVEAQKAELGKKENLLSHYVQQGHSINEASRLAMADLKDYYGAQLEATASKFAGPEALALAKQHRAEIARQTIMERSTLRDQAQQQDLRAVQIAEAKRQAAIAPDIQQATMAAESGKVLPEEAGVLLDPKRRVRVPGGWVLANDEKDRADLSNIQEAYKNGLAAIKRYEDLGSTTGIGGSDTSRGKLAVQDALNAYQAILGRSNAPRGQQEEELEKALTNPTSALTTRGGVKDRAKLFREILAKHMTSANAARLVGGERAAAGMYGGE